MAALTTRSKTHRGQPSGAPVCRRQRRLPAHFNATTGDEVWAYLPRFIMPGVYQLADTAYSANHRFFVDGSPETGDVFDSSANRWKTIIVGGAAAGGRGFYALDITDANTPLALWEFCADSTLCTNNDPDVGLAYGNPVIGMRPDGRWVVVLSSGLNNVSPVPAEVLLRARRDHGPGTEQDSDAHFQHQRGHDRHALGAHEDRRLLRQSP